jgi:hypothetical protein
MNIKNELQDDLVYYRVTPYKLGAQYNVIFS